MERMEFRRDITRFLNEDQYLKQINRLVLLMKSNLQELQLQAAIR